MFRFDSFHMYGVIASAVLVAAVSVWLLKRLRPTSFTGEPISFTPKARTYPRYVLGGTLFGIGWALTGPRPNRCSRSSEAVSAPSGSSSQAPSSGHGRTGNSAPSSRTSSSRLSRGCARPRLPRRSVGTARCLLENFPNVDGMLTRESNSLEMDTLQACALWRPLPGSRHFARGPDLLL
jgi:hypothetical protein